MYKYYNYEKRIIISYNCAVHEFTSTDRGDPENPHGIMEVKNAVGQNYGLVISAVTSIEDAFNPFLPQTEEIYAVDPYWINKELAITFDLSIGGNVILNDIIRIEFEPNSMVHAYSGLPYDGEVTLTNNYNINKIKIN